MPKIIEDLRGRLVEEARRQAKTAGYSAVTIRSVAAACGVGVGTVYNYFASKDALLAAFLLADWQACIAAMERESASFAAPEQVLQRMHTHLRSYLEQHRNIFGDAAAAPGFGSAEGTYHALLRKQLAAPLRRFCESDFAADFAAEALLTWTVADTPWETLLPIMKKLF